MLTVENMNVYYGKIHAVKDVSFEVHEGETVSLIGANGAGKSTILQTISGLIPAKTGVIKFDGEDISKVESYKLVKKGLAHVPEGRRCFLDMSVLENLQMGCFTRSGKGISKDMEAVFELFPRLKERLHQEAGTLSGGEQQMLAIGRALMSRPKLFWMSLLWVLPPFWWSRFSRSFSRSTAREPPSSWWNRMRKWRCRSPTERMYWNLEESFSPEPAKNLQKTLM